MAGAQQPHLVEPPWADAAVAAYATGKSLRAVAGELGVGQVPVWRVIHFRGLCRPRIGAGSARHPEPPPGWEERAVAAYKGGLTLAEAAAAAGAGYERTRTLLAMRRLLLSPAEAARRSRRMGHHREGTFRPPATLTPGTRYTYERRYGLFERWCGALGLCPLPATADTYYAYLLSLQDAGLSRGTVSGVANAIRWVHRNAGQPLPGKIPRPRYREPSWDATATA